MYRRGAPACRILPAVIVRIDALGDGSPTAFLPRSRLPRSVQAAVKTGVLAAWQSRGGAAGPAAESEEAQKAAVVALNRRAMATLLGREFQARCVPPHKHCLFFPFWRAIDRAA